MKDFKIGLQRIVKRAVKSFYNFPAAILSAMVVAIVAFVRIQMDYDLLESYNFLLASIQLAFIFGAAFSMLIVALKQIDKLKISKSISSIIGLLSGIVTFLLLYFLGGDLNGQGIRYLTDISIARVSVAIFISIVIFIYTISKSKSIKTFPNAFFITHKAYVISIIYGLVLMIGISGVLGAFQTLVYRGMSNNLYGYAGVIIGFLTYSIFLGYFPIFEQDPYEDKEKKELQPKFIVVLFDYILAPIIIALTLVLFIWSARVLLNGIDVSFNQLSAIATSYVLVGIWLHIMLANHETGIAKFYRKAYPFSGILILLFQGWALLVQLGESGLKTTEYSFILLWIFAAISVGLLILLKKDSYRKIAILASCISLIAVLPYIGYHVLPLKMQIDRLEEILIRQEILVDNTILKSQGDLDEKDKVAITDAVNFISYTKEGEKPGWIKGDLTSDQVFEDTFGFKKTYKIEEYPDGNRYFSTNLNLATQSIDISDYNLSINIGFNKKDQMSTSFENKGVEYEVIWDSMDIGIPKLIVKSDDEIIIEKSMENFLAEIEKNYPPGDYREIDASFEDMSLKIETDEISILLIFNTININNNTNQGIKDYYMDLKSIYIK